MNKKILSYLIVISLVISMFSFGFISIASTPTTYYIDTAGSNSNNGTSSSTPWADFTNVNSKTFNPGDQILLKCGNTWTQQMTLQGTGTSGSHITVSSYGTGSRPAIVGNNTNAFHCITLTNGDYWDFSNLDLSACGYGIYCHYTTNGHNGLTFTNIYIHGGNDNNVNYLHDIIVWCDNPSSTNGQYSINGITVTNCNSYQNGGTCFGAGSYGASTFYPWAIENVFQCNCTDYDDPIGTSAQNASHVTYLDCNFNNNQTEAMPQGTTNLFYWNCQYMNFINCMIQNSPNTNSYDQCGIDTEAWDDSFSYIGSYFGYNAGAGLEFLALSGRPGDFNTNHRANNNTFVNNGQAGSTQFRGSLYEDNYTGASFTGTASNNLFSEQYPGNGNGGFTNTANSGSFSNWTLTNNTSISNSANIYNSGVGYSTTTQGANQWSYQTYNGSTWSNATYDSSNSRWGSTSNGIVNQFDEMPNNTNTNWVARAWTAPGNGTISIRGQALKEMTGGDGMYISITKNGTQIWPTSGGAQLLASGDQSGYSTNLDNISVSAGDVIRFQANNGGSGSNTGDWVSWLPTVAYTSGGNAPGSFALSTPSNGATGVSTLPTFSWGSSSGASTYTLVVSTNSNLSSPVVNQTGISTTSYTIGTGLSASTVYYWKVTAVNSNGSTDASNSNFNFTTGTSSLPSPVSNWSFQNNCNDSVGSNNGTANGGTSYVTGKSGNAISLDGSSGYVNVPDSTTLDGMSQLTVSVWVKLAALPSSGNSCLVIDKENSAGGAYRIAIGSDGTTHLAVQTTNNGWYSSGTTAVLATKLTTGTWYNIVGTYDGSYTHIYLNGTGQVNGLQSISGNIVRSSGNPVRMGYPTSGAPNLVYLNGVIDEAQVYSTALSATQVQALYNSYSGGSAPGAFTLTSPSNSATGVSTTPTFSWGSSSGASTYTLIVSTNSNLSSPVVNQSGISTTSYTSGTALSNSTVYYWKVTAVNSYGNTDASNSNFSFTTGASTNVLSNNSFENGTTNWTSNCESISTVTSPTPEAGSYEAQASSRSQVDSWIGQDVFSTISADGQGNYTVSAWVRTPSTTDSFSVSIAVQCNGTWQNEFKVTANGNSSGWTQITGVLNVTWTGTLTDAIFIVRQNTDTSNYYVDNCSLIH